MILIKLNLEVNSYHDYAIKDLPKCLSSGLNVMMVQLNHLII